MEELFDSLKNWGCDVDGALARFIGDRELYRSCLHTAAGRQEESASCNLSKKAV